MRRALLCGLAIGLVASTGATAATRPKPKILCNMLVDKAGDGTWGMAGAVKSSALDITGGDLSTGNKELVAVLKVGTTSTAGDNFAAALSYEWQMSAVAGGSRYLFSVTRPSIVSNGKPDVWAVTVAGVALGKEAYETTMTPTTFEWRLKRPLIKAMNRPKLIWQDFTGSSFAMSSTADRAPDTNTSQARYPDRAPSCLKAK